jgi:hypothetical protein
MCRCVVGWVCGCVGVYTKSKSSELSPLRQKLLRNFLLRCARKIQKNYCRRGGFTTVTSSSQAAKAEGSRKYGYKDQRRGGITNATKDQRRESITEVNKERRGSITKVNKERRGSITTVRAAKLFANLPYTKVNKERRGSITNVNKERRGSITNVNKERIANLPYTKVNQELRESITNVNKERRGSITNVNKERRGSITNVNKERRGSITKGHNKLSSEPSNRRKKKQSSYQKLIKVDSIDGNVISSFGQLQAK